MTWWIGSDQLLKVEGLRDPVQDIYVNTASVRATMTDDAGTQVPGQSWPLVLDYVSASEGNYQGILEDGLELADGRRYWMELTADAGGDLIKKWRWSDIARHRRPTDP